MGAKTKKIKSFGKFGSRFGVYSRKNFNVIEEVQRKKQRSPFYPKGRAVRIAAGIWKCKKTGKVFASNAYYLEPKK